MGTGLAASAAHPRRNQIWVPPPPPPEFFILKILWSSVSAFKLFYLDILHKNKKGWLCIKYALCQSILSGPIASDLMKKYTRCITKFQHIYYSFLFDRHIFLSEYHIINPWWYHLYLWLLRVINFVVFNVNLHCLCLGFLYRVAQKECNTFDH